MQHFLQLSFGVFGLGVGVELLDAVGEQALHGGFGGGEVGIKADGGEQGFYGIGEDGGAVVAAAFEFARAEV